jgi:transposase
MERHAIECMFGKLKYFRRIATPFEKKASHFMKILAFTAVFLWMR